MTDLKSKLRELSENFDHQLKYANDVREFFYSVVQAKHMGEFHRKDYIAFALLARCLQTHEAVEILIRASFVDDGWVLVRALVEHAVNCGYMLQVADDQTADDFAQYPDYKLYLELQDLKASDEELVREAVSAEKEQELREKYEAIRERFDKRRGDQWCADDRLYKRAASLDVCRSKGTEKQHCFLSLVNSVWRHGSAFTHGRADALAAQMGKADESVEFHRKYTTEEATQVLVSATFALYFLFPIVDDRLGGKNREGFRRYFGAWIGASER